MVRHLNIDIETYSDIDIKKSGLYKYCSSPNFEVLLFAYSFDFGPVEIVDLANGEKLPQEVLDALQDNSVVKHAYNAPFEISCLNAAGFKTPAEQWRCTMLHGLYLGYPAGLAALGNAVGLPEDKKKFGIGLALIRYFCVPCKPTKSNGGRSRNFPKHDTAKWELFKSYCRQDVASEMEIYQRLASFEVPDEVQRDWLIDYALNSRGISLDMELVEGALAIDAEHKELLTEKAVALTGLSNPNSRTQLLNWINENTELELEDLTKGTVAEQLSITTDEKAKELLEVRRELSKSSVSKYAAMQNAVCSDGRVRGLLQFYGANRTGRWAGRLVQVQNLPRNYIENLDAARHLVKKHNRRGLNLLYGDISDTLSQLIRTAFVAPEGKTLCVSDFSAIEARVLAWLAGEQWRLDVFAGHGKIYEASASQMFGVPIEKIKKGEPEYALRQKGKVAELALGYQGGPGALISMGALNMGLHEEELPEVVRLWRNSNRAITAFWYQMEQAVIEVMQTAQPQVVARGMVVARECNAVYGNDFLTVKLPSGRKLYYPHPYLQENKFGKMAVHYKAVGENNKWGVNSTYGGKMVENITQAVARDCLALALRRLVEAGYVPLMHIHDEVVLEVPKTELHEDELERINKIMCEPIPWAPGLKLNAAGFISDYYMKD